MASFNRVILIGNITRDPELRYTPNSMAVTDVGLAVNDRRKSQSGEWVDETTFIDITLWGRTAEVVCEYCTKGSPLMVEGRLKLDSWEGNDGQKKSKLKVIGERIQLLGSKGSGSGGGGESRGYSRQQNQSHSQDNAYSSQPSYDSDAAAPSAPDDDVPF